MYEQDFGISLFDTTIATKVGGEGAEAVDRSSIDISMSSKLLIALLFILAVQMTIVTCTVGTKHACNMD